MYENELLGLLLVGLLCSAYGLVCIARSLRRDIELNACAKRERNPRRRRNTRCVRFGSGPLARTLFDRGALR